MDSLSEEEIKNLKELLNDQPTLHKIAKKEEAWTLVISNVTRVAVWVVGGVGLFVSFGGYLKDFAKWLVNT